MTSNQDIIAEINYIIRAGEDIDSVVTELLSQKGAMMQPHD